ncbi:ribonuclease P protein component [Aurantibacter aestuarii]|uniref:Ribonuclease P protein component n=1 Tax=Aurantibacter aestuarii TaxID=1266046 RepID=A0A2T1ND08_9FLAO|nr:ribonuclease P protein component [Aurantibacter aestuarii]PSG90314.1 ribonuclease P protein component [Aurantibacter aestuarii]
MDFTYKKNEKLKSKKAVDQIFTNGKSISAYPLRLVFVKNNTSLKVGVSVSKRNFKNAVHRNRIKRLLREAYRLNKSVLYDNQLTDYAFMIIYNHKDMPDFELINEKTKKLFHKFIEQNRDVTNF